MSRTFNDIFQAPTLVTYPPFSKGVLIEQYMNEFLKKFGSITNRKYINVDWTNLYVNSTFKGVHSFDKNKLQDYLNTLNKNEKYFTVVQLDDGVLYNLPPDTLVFGCCSNIPIPLVYPTDVFQNLPKKSFQEKKIFCSFVGSLTHDVRRQMISQLNRSVFYFLVKEWTSNVPTDQATVFVNVSLDSKYVLAPRGYGKNSFRFWEALELGAVPIYIWDDIEFLPFKDVIDYTKLCVSINVSNLAKLESILNSISEDEYNKMREYYQSVKHLFTYQGMCEYIIQYTNEN